MDRSNKSKVEYGSYEENNNGGGFGNFGNFGDTTEIKVLKQKKRNDFVASLEEQLRLKSERQKKEREQENSYNYPPQPSSSHSRRSQQHSAVETYELPVPQKPQSRGESNNLPGYENR